MTGSDRQVEKVKHCDYCGQVYYEPADWPVSPEYMWQGHVLFDCPDPDQMHRAWLNASPQENSEVWP